MDLGKFSEVAMRWSPALSVIFLLFLLVACGGSPIERAQSKGEGVTRALLKEFQKIHCRKDILEREGRLKRLFQELVTTILEVDAVAIESQEEAQRGENRYSQALQDELIRLYQIDGVREIVEDCQREALYRLDKGLRRRGQGLV